MIEIERFAYSPMGTFGRLRTAEFQCFTVECPWINNEPWVSCIPEGEYALARSRFHRGGYDAYEITEVPDRSRILIHIGNTMNDLRGCIAPGADLGFIHGKWAVVRSKPTYYEMMSTLLEPKGVIQKIRISHILA